MKRTVAFNEQQIAAWYGALSTFPDWIVNRAILELAISETRFPEFGDVYQLCRRHALKEGVLKQAEYCPNGSDKVERKITNNEIHSIGHALQLTTENPARRRLAE